MGAIAVHHTATEEGAWDGPANEAKLESGRDAAYYRKAFAWMDPEGDETTKAAYRFIHHFVSGDGTPGAASTVASSAGIAVLNGGRGGTTIPDGDRQGVYNHLAAHLRDADKEPPDLRDYPQEIERRTLCGEIRAIIDEGKARIIGYAAVFDQLSEDLGGWREVIKPGAFTEALGDDVRALFNHDPSMILGRTTAGTLRLMQDDIGLRYEINPPDTSYARDLLESIKRGDVNQSSFGFQVIDQEFNPPEAGSTFPVREVKAVRLYDVSPVTFPAYPVTTVDVRMQVMALAAPGRATGAAQEQKAAGRLSMLRKRLQLAERE